MYKMQHLEGSVTPVLYQEARFLKVNVWARWFNLIRYKVLMGMPHGKCIAGSRIALNEFQRKEMECT
jgi:hypothetical protein